MFIYKVDFIRMDRFCWTTVVAWTQNKAEEKAKKKLNKHDELTEVNISHFYRLRHIIGRIKIKLKIYRQRRS